MPDLVLHVGSRGGGYAALLFFSVIFATLGGVAAWEYHKQRLGGRGPAVLAGLAVFLGLLMLVYYSSLNGFYEAQLSPTHLELRYLPPFSRERVAWSETHAPRCVRRTAAVGVSTSFLLRAENLKARPRIVTLSSLRRGACKHKSPLRGNPSRYAA